VIDHGIGVTGRGALDTGATRWSASSGSRGGSSRDQQCFEIGGGARIAAFDRTAESCLRTGEIAALGENRTQVARRRGLSSLVGESIGAFGSLDVTAFLQQQTEIERAVGIAAFLPAAVRGLGPDSVATILQQDPEVYRRGSVSPRIGVAVSAFSRGKIAPLLEQDAEIEPADGVGALINGPVSAPRHASQALRFAKR